MEEKVKSIIIKVIKKWTKVNIEDISKSLFEYGIPVEDFMYIILELEEKYKLPIIEVIKHGKYEEFNVKNIAEYCAKIDCF